MQQEQSIATRREILRRILILSGAGALASVSSVLNAAIEGPADRVAAANATPFSALQIAWLDEVAETILPQTDTPGAKAVHTGAFIALMVSDTYGPAEQAHFRTGMTELETRCRQAYGAGFAAAAADQRLELLTELDREQHDLPDQAMPHYFAMIKQLTLLGYFTSEVGYTQALRYVESPGRFDPCVDYQAGTPSWANHA